MQKEQNIILKSITSDLKNYIKCMLISINEKFNFNRSRYYKALQKKKKNIKVIRIGERSE